MREFKPKKKTLWLWQIRVALMWLVLSAFCKVFFGDNSFFLPLIAFISALFIVINFLYLPKYFSLCKIKCLKQAVVVEKGVIFKYCHILPFSRLIFSQTINTPLSKAFGLTALTLKAARSYVFIPELKESEAREILEILVNGETK
ncbi:MAG: hypothetical protein IKY45_04500 [Clostridia bacterium]|nr:hypothetical protein [Clostridia bacterium]MBR4973704.1 hypothetical protein [Clostridia bacterium]